MNAATTAHLPSVQLEHICSYWATLAPPEVIGPVPEGIRAHFYVTAGEVSGPKMRGRLRSVGGDWLVIRNDGVGVLDVRATMELDNGAVIYTTSTWGQTAITCFCKEFCRLGQSCESPRDITHAIPTTCGSTACSV